MTDVVIVSAARTAVGKFGGTLAKIAAPELGATVIRAVLERAGVKPEQVSEVILGQVLAAGSGQNPARQSLIKAGLPSAVPGMTINKVCGSGLKAVMLAANAIIAGDADIVIAGGQENMSAAPHVLPGSRDGFRMGDAKLVDTMIVDGLWDVYNQYHMGITAENVAAYANAGVDPSVMGMGPVPASRRCLERAGWTPGDLDLMEINEAFAAQALAVHKQMGWDTSKVNVNGGAIAIGHPIGASGCRILVTLLHEMVKRDAKRGLASLCIGGGMGVALAVERG
ncbi:hypothetical protein CJO66_29460 [Burkholderia ubonensis]|uniref:thiolase family protein n=1 Tax=Burkholderia ubonensis TaxID=101571 RepID=UPI000BA5F2BB|nr:beta-ketoacyl synthase N-terminal-like domain-containing protein [Burkholderia ubonensis]PAK11182.1 hypothetical protein CJO66_29460 [Burkholderia ubonensis]